MPSVVDEGGAPATASAVANCADKDENWGLGGAVGRDNVEGFGPNCRLHDI